MLFPVKLNPEFSSELLEEAKAILALSLVLLASKKKTIAVSVGWRSFDRRAHCGRNQDTTIVSGICRKKSQQRAGV